MTKKQTKIAIGAAVALAVGWWLLRSKDASAAQTMPTAVTATGDVLLGTPTVTGSSATSGGTDYTTNRCPDCIN